ncbi:MAG TPA: hypothetical protein VL330_10690 [Actinomycetes bacterium]|nr:hypothetical protein [Actinomycetes bacterium]
MSNRDLGVSALGRFLAVERYRESQQPSLSTQPLRSAGAGRTGGDAGKAEPRTGFRAPARVQDR